MAASRNKRTKAGERTQPDQPPRAIAYLRFSPRPDAAVSESLEGQEYAVRNWCLSQGLDLGAIYRDKDVSGADASRKEMWKAVDAARKGVTLVVYSLSRLSRDTMLTLTIEQRITKQGGNLVSVTEPFDTRTPVGQMLFKILAAWAEYERECSRERTRNALARLRHEGKRISGKAPYGYRFVPDERGTETVMLAEEYIEQVTLRYVRLLRHYGKYPAAVCSRLNRNQRYMRSGKPWNVKAVRRVLLPKVDAKNKA